MDATSTAELTPQQIAEDQAAKDRELLAALQNKRLAQMAVTITPNRAMRRLAARHANRSWTPPLNPRAKRERRALARAGIFIRNHAIEA